MKKTNTLRFAALITCCIAFNYSFAAEEKPGKLIYTPDIDVLIERGHKFGEQGMIVRDRGNILARLHINPDLTVHAFTAFKEIKSRAEAGYSITLTPCKSTSEIQEHNCLKKAIADFEQAALNLEKRMENL